MKEGRYARMGRLSVDRLPERVSRSASGDAAGNDTGRRLPSDDGGFDDVSSRLSVIEGSKGKFPVLDKDAFKNKHRADPIAFRKFTFEGITCEYCVTGWRDDMVVYWIGPDKDFEDLYFDIRRPWLQTHCKPLIEAILRDIKDDPNLTISDEMLQRHARWNEKAARLNHKTSGVCWS